MLNNCFINPKILILKYAERLFVLHFIQTKDTNIYVFFTYEGYFNRF